MLSSLIQAVRQNELHLLALILDPCTSHLIEQSRILDALEKILTLHLCHLLASRAIRRERSECCMHDALSLHTSATAVRVRERSTL